MREMSAYYLQSRAKTIVDDLYRITVTDAWDTSGGGNIEATSQASQMHSMSAVLAGIKGTGGRAPSKLGGRNITQSKESWLSQGQRTLAKGKGICTDCAAAAAVKFLKIVDSCRYEARVEIISTSDHAFVVVNREGYIKIPDFWGANAFIIDIWYRNQYPQDSDEVGVFWAYDRAHPVSQYMRELACYLRVEVVFRDVTGSLLD